MRADVAAGQSFTDEVVAASSGTFDRWLLGRIRRPLATAPIRFRLWDGYELSPPTDPPSRDDRNQEPPRADRLGA